MVDTDFLVTEIERGAQPFAAKVEPATEHQRAAVLAGDRHLAVAVSAVDPQTPGAIAAEAPGDVETAAEVLASGVAERGAGQRLVAGALEQQVHAAAEARAAGRRAVDESGGAVQHLNALEQFRRDQLAGRDAVKAVEADVVAVQREAADHELLGRVAVSVSGADRRVVIEHLA